MDDPSFLTGISTLAKKRRARKLGICNCGAMFATHNKDCRKKGMGLHYLMRLDWVRKGRVANSETLYPALVGWICKVYKLCEITMFKSDDCYCEDHLSYNRNEKIIKLIITGREPV
uniref:Putative RNA binding protein n=1 Tax=Heracleum latent virus TaxID=48876 RepID=A0A6G9IUM5_9VIRU|nr:putative RNA binding protein [Heracleum latent virus]